MVATVRRLSRKVYPPCRLALLLRTPLFWAYWPVRISARAGQHSGCGESIWVTVGPWGPMAARGRGMYFMSLRVWSSVVIRTMLGRLGAGAAWAPLGLAEWVATAVMRAAVTVTTTAPIPSRWAGTIQVPFGSATTS